MRRLVCRQKVQCNSPFWDRCDTDRFITHLEQADLRLQANNDPQQMISSAHGFPLRAKTPEC